MRSISDGGARDVRHEHPAVSTKLRSGTGQWIAEGVATFGRLLVILRAPGSRVAAMVAAYIGAAYWFPNQSSVAKAFAAFTDEGRMKPSSLYDRVVDVVEEPFKFTLLTRDLSSYLLNRYSERKESAADLAKRVNLPVAPGCGCGPKPAAIAISIVAAG